MSMTMVQAKSGWKSSTIIVNGLFFLSILPELIELVIASGRELGIPDAWLPWLTLAVTAFNLGNRRRTEQPIRFRQESINAPVAVPAGPPTVPRGR